MTVGALRQGAEGRAAPLVREIGLAGLVSGAAAGAAMAAFFMLLGTWRGLGWLGVPQGIGALFYGWGAMGRGPPAFWGLAVHFTVSVGLGVLFAAIVPRNAEPLASVTGGILYAIAVWAVMTWVVIRVIDRPLADVVDHMPFGWLGAHVTFGIVLGAASQLRGLAAGVAPPRRR
jgi:hypothetical protein